MRLSSLIQAWNTFFFEPQSPVPIAVFRILYGVLVMATLVLLRPDWLNWFGTHAWVSLPTMHHVEPGTRINLFALFPQSDAWVETIFWVALASAMFLATGLFTRVRSVIVFLCLTSIDQRNLFLTHGGDTFLRVTGFFLIFAPAGAAISVDRFLRIRRGKEDAAIIVPQSPWAQRMIQIEVSLLYVTAFFSKAQGIPWVGGTALYYVYHLDELRRFPVPAWLLHPAMVKLATWSALTLELFLGTLIWIVEFRYYVMALGLFMHLSLEYSLNIPMFQWDVMSAYVLFIDPTDLARASKWVRARIG
ncbi:MAG TPA: HTTM domain-containing protein [Bryobacteraceae bacterium]|nr:HTTM domain-containing protein [Bryobacteraceae bacterium]